MTRNLILVGGLYHDFAGAAATLSEQLDAVDIESTISADIDASLARLGEFDLLTVFALRWTMPQDRFAADRARWAYSPGERERAAIDAHLRAGRGILALHTAAICFDDWPRWREIVGASWTWGVSHHPPLGAVHVRGTATSHPIVAGMPSFTLVDEAYTAMDQVADLAPIAEVRAESQEHYSPCLWVREHGAARVVYDALGHDSASVSHPAHARVLQRAALWATHRELPQ